MGWLSKILRGSSSSSSSFKSKKKSRCTCRDHGESSTVDNVDSSEEGSAENSEPDDVDCSTTSSLYEGSEKELDEEDERLALALRRNLSFDSHPQFDSTTIFQTYPSVYSAYRSCVTCHEEIYGAYCPRCANSFWLTPEYCTQDQIIIPTNFVNNNENYSWPYPSQETYCNIHPHLRCDVCQRLVPANSSGNPQCIKTPIWSQIYCHHHERDGTARCFTCRRLQPFGTKYSALSDGRRICSDCQQSAIASGHECQPLIDEIQRFYEGLVMKVDQQFPFKLVDLKELNKNRPVSRSVGLTTVIELPLRTKFEFPVYGPDNKLVKIVTEPHKLVSYTEVLHIQVLNNTPRLYTGITLAHEMMHAWLILNGSYMKIRGDKEFGYMGIESDKVHEGICNVMGYMWLESEIQAMSRSKHISSSRLNFERKLAQHLKLAMEGNQDPIYGYGFKLMHRAVTKYGLKGTLDYLRMTGALPVCDFP